MYKYCTYNIETGKVTAYSDGVRNELSLAEDEAQVELSEEFGAIGMEEGDTLTFDGAKLFQTKKDGTIITHSHLNQED